MTLRKLLRDTFAAILGDKTATILASAVLVLVLWGNAGAAGWLSLLWKGWTGPGSYGDPRRAVIVPGIPFDQELLSFLFGTVLLVVVPLALLKLRYREDASEYGLGLPPRDRRSLVVWSSIALLVVCAPGIWFGAHQPEMRALYPLFRHFASNEQFLAYELAYFLFFLASEFVFRGYILFGAARTMPAHVAICVAMLAHVTWHLGKPFPELASSVAWSFFAGAIALGTRTIWHLIVIHWLLNVFMDLVIWKGW